MSMLSCICTANTVEYSCISYWGSTLVVCPHPLVEVDGAHTWALQGKVIQSGWIQKRMSFLPSACVLGCLWFFVALPTTPVNIRKGAMVMNIPCSR